MINNIKFIMNNHQIMNNIQYMNNLTLIECINILPKDIQKRIYIMTWKGFWKEYTPLTAKPPSWLKHYNYVKNTLWEAKQKNIHFLHLPFNTLPENKKWIMGCQCDFCLNDNSISEIEKHCHYLVQYRNSYYFEDKFMENCKSNSSNWNQYLVPIKTINDINNYYHYNKVFDPLCGSYKENSFTKNLRNNTQFTFSDYDFLI